MGRALATIAGMALQCAGCLAPGLAPAAEAEWPTRSAGELSAFLALETFRSPAEHCVAMLPRLKPDFDRRLQDLQARVQGISTGLLATEPFSVLKGMPVPAQIVDAFRDSFEDARHNFERRDAEAACPMLLQKLDAVEDEGLASGLREILTGMRTMIRNLEKDGDG